MKLKRRVPEIRFRGFSGEWENATFKEISKINQGLQIAISERYSYKVSGSHFYITNEFLKDNCDISYFVKDPSENVLCSTDDILMTRTGNTGAVVTNIQGVFHNNFFKINFDRNILKKDYLFHFLKLDNTQKKILTLAGNSTIPDLNHNDFYNLKINYPKREEQTKIGNYFQHLDRLIEEKAKKEQKLKSLKKAMLQKMFPKDGATTPEIRFKEFSGEWEEKELKNLITHIIDNRGKNPKYYLKHGIPIIDNFMIKNNFYPELTKATRFIDNNLFDTFIRTYPELHDVLITLVGNGIGNITLFPKQKSVIIQNTLGMRFDNDKIFMFYRLLSIHSKIKLLNRGMAQPSIRQDELLNLILKLPASIPEQTKIGNYFQKLDSLINLQHQELEKLKNLKKAFLSKMFV